MSKAIYRVKNTTFEDIINVGAGHILESFLEVLKDEIEKGNTIIIEQYNPIVDTTFPLNINNLNEFEEFKNTYLR